MRELSTWKIMKDHWEEVKEFLDKDLVTLGLSGLLLIAACSFVIMLGLAAGRG